MVLPPRNIKHLCFAVCASAFPSLCITFPNDWLKSDSSFKAWLTYYFLREPPGIVVGEAFQFVTCMGIFYVPSLLLLHVSLTACYCCPDELAEGRSYARPLCMLQSSCESPLPRGTPIAPTTFLHFSLISFSLCGCCPMANLHNPLILRSTEITLSFSLCLNAVCKALLFSQGIPSSIWMHMSSKCDWGKTPSCTNHNLCPPAKSPGTLNVLHEHYFIFSTCAVKWVQLATDYLKYGLSKLSVRLGWPLGHSYCLPPSVSPMTSSFNPSSSTSDRDSC